MMDNDDGVISLTLQRKRGVRERKCTKRILLLTYLCLHLCQRPILQIQTLKLKYNAGIMLMLLSCHLTAFSFSSRFLRLSSEEGQSFCSMITADLQKI